MGIADGWRRAARGQRYSEVPKQPFASGDRQSHAQSAGNAMAPPVREPLDERAPFPPALPSWSMLNFETCRFEIESEMLTRFVEAGHEVTFVPIQVIYRNETSKIDPILDTLRWFRWWSHAS
jgi:hypothetical protein